MAIWLYIAIWLYGYMAIYSYMVGAWPHEYAHMGQAIGQERVTELKDNRARKPFTYRGHKGS